MKLQFLSAALLLSLSQFSFSASLEPASCPSVAALKAVGVKLMVKEDDAWYGFVQADNYSTKENWTFRIGQFKAENEKDAKSQAINATSSLRYLSGPRPFENKGNTMWVCYYTNNYGNTAVTVTPPLEDFKYYI